MIVLSLLRTLSLSSPPSQRTTEISFRPAPFLVPAPTPGHLPFPSTFGPPPPPLAPTHPGTSPIARVTTPAQQGLGLAPALKTRPCRRKGCQRQALPCSRGAYLHTIILLVSSTLPSYGGEKVEGYQHQAGHQGPQGEEKQHLRAGGRHGAGSAI